MTEQKLTTIPKLSFAFVNSPSDDIVLNGQNSACVAGASLSQYWEHITDCAKFELTFGSGCNAAPSSLFKFSNYNDFQQEIYPQTYENENQKLRKCLVSLSLLNIENTSCNLSFGFQRDISPDSNGGFKGGWNNYDPRKYYGYGWGGFINPFIINKEQNVGFKLDYNNEKYKIFANYLNFPKTCSSRICRFSSRGQVLDWFDGFLGKKQFSECNIGITSENNIKIPFSFMLVLSQLNRGNGWASDLIDENAARVAQSNSEIGNNTASVREAIELQLYRKQKLNYLTTTISKEIKPNFDLNCALSCANVNFNDFNNVDIKDTILKYSLGCVSKCNYSNNINIAYGFNIGTPAYLKSKEIPFICEVNCLFKLYGLNIPLYFDYMNKKEGFNSSSDLIYSSALTCGINPLTIFGFEKNEKGGVSCFTKDIIDCIEGGLNEDE